MDTFDAGLLILRVGVGLTFAAHGAQKLFGWWGGPGMTTWRGAMERMGFRPVGLFASASALIELVGGPFLAIGLLTPLAGAALLAQSVVIIGQVHLPNGFWNSKSAIEFALVVGLVAVVLIGAGSWSLDSAIGFLVGADLRATLVAVGVVVGLLALAVPRLSSNRPAPQA